MKKFLCVMLVFSMVLLLFGCLNTSRAQTEPTTTQPATEPVPSTTEIPAWKPFEGSLEDYVYYYSGGQNRMWEEDLLYLAEIYLDEHALLTPEESLVNYRVGASAYDGYYTDEFYKPELREAFLAEVNALIPKLEEMNNQEFVYALEKLLALLHDAHAYIINTSDKEFFNVLVLREDEHYYALGLPLKHKDLLYSELTAINHIPLAEVIEMLRPYISYETEDYFLGHLTSPFYYSALFNADLLQIVGVTESERAEFTFLTEEGEKTVELEAQTVQQLTFSSRASSVFYDSPLFENLERNYWHEFMGNALYFRISNFEQETEKNMMQEGNEMLAEVKEKGGIEKIIVDLRQNGGGYQMLGYHELVGVFRRINPEKIYVLIDTGTFSQSVVFATILKQDLDNVTLVGVPAGQAPNFFGKVERYTMPNTATEFSLAGSWWSTWEDYEYEALMPDVEVKQTLQDHKDNRDAVLQYVLQQ